MDGSANPPPGVFCVPKIGRADAQPRNSPRNSPLAADRMKEVRALRMRLEQIDRFEEREADGEMLGDEEVQEMNLRLALEDELARVLNITDG